MGDMDFKVAGIDKGITAIQMDIKIKGIDEAILRQALVQAREARLFILSKMLSVISELEEGIIQICPKDIHHNY